ncbi:dienelactone hydrolase family protein [Microlunatus soli]|uniref:Alpha/beta hydrolase n=1 Tax=Microlunatus soli TaxID=630515 RepID=A0A1H1P4R9_9ACTN|nr:alpha/beta hydrolase [Microlunatus soli]SDS05985.1 hypothetical protein SAMN04489812_0756 [Microlunatus soli]
MKTLEHTISDGVTERSFILGEVPGVLWTPTTVTAPAPLVLMGHGGGLHKRSPDLVARARRYVARYGFSVAAIDSPGHGERPRSVRDQQWVAKMLQARESGRPMGPIIAEYNGSLAERAIGEWRATIDALQELPEIGPDAPIGYSGMTLASAIGLPLITVEPRISAAVVGGVFVYDVLMAAARMITIPIRFLLPWDDHEIDRQTGLDLFDAFGSTEKSLLATTGGHHELPSYVADEAARFFVRQFGRSAAVTT